MPLGTYTLHNGEIESEVDSLRLVVCDSERDPSRRHSGIWKFFTAKTGKDFFVTSQALQSDMKGTVHFTQAHFGFSKPFREAVPAAWVGPLPPSRLYHTLRIRDLVDGEMQEVFYVDLPGFALLTTPAPLPAKKRYVRIAPPPPTFELRFALTLVQGDWRAYTLETERHRVVGLLSGERDRHALITVAMRPYEDPRAALKNFNRNLKLIGDAHELAMPEEEMGIILWMERGEDDPIRIVELNGVQPGDNPEKSE